MRINTVWAPRSEVEALGYALARKDQNEGLFIKGSDNDGETYLIYISKANELLEFLRSYNYDIARMA